MNPIQQNYVVGERDNSPKYPHSALSAGFSSLAEAIANPTDLSHSHTIYGGNSRKALIWDFFNNFTTCISYRWRTCKE